MNWAHNLLRFNELILIIENQSLTTEQQVTEINELIYTNILFRII